MNREDQIRQWFSNTIFEVPMSPDSGLQTINYDHNPISKMNFQSLKEYEDWVINQIEIYDQSDTDQKFDKGYELIFNILPMFCSDKEGVLCKLVDEINFILEKTKNEDVNL